MHNEGGGGAFLGGDLVLVGPATVVGHGAAFEHRIVEFRRVPRVGHRRVVDKHHDSLAAHINSFEIVPAVLRSHDSIADEHQLRVRHLDFGNEPFGPDNSLAANREIDAFPADDIRQTHVAGRHSHQGHRRNERSVGIARFESHALELINQVTDGELLAFGSRRAAFELVRRQCPDVAHQTISRNARRGFLHVGAPGCAQRSAGNCRRDSAGP